MTLLLLLPAADAAAAVVPTAGRVATAWRSPLAAPHRATALRTPLAPSLQIALGADSAAEGGQTQTQQYLNSLSRFADDGRTLNAPQRYSSKDWLANLRSISSCRVLEAIRGQLLVQIVWALLISLLYIVAPSLPSLPALPHSLLGGVLGVLLGFRTNQSYDRFWEARKLWGGVFTHCRSLSRMGIAYIDSDRSAYECMQRHLKAFPLALKQHLRGEREPQEFAGTLSTPELNEVISADSMPLAVCPLTRIRKSPPPNRLASAVAGMHVVCGGCERDQARRESIIECSALVGVRGPHPQACLNSLRVRAPRAHARATHILGAHLASPLAVDRIASFRPRRLLRARAAPSAHRAVHRVHRLLAALHGGAGASRDRAEICPRYRVGHL